MMKILHLLSNPYLLLVAILFSAVGGSAILSSWCGGAPRMLETAHAVEAEEKTAPTHVGAKKPEEPNPGFVCCEADCNICSTSNMAVKAKTKFWQNYHTHMLPVAVGLFMLSLSGWSLLGVENLAARDLKEAGTLRRT
ncbi:hypothetical protein SH449x_003193 [Pirellulaceae bacterium SH449]